MAMRWSSWGEFGIVAFFGWLQAIRKIVAVRIAGRKCFIDDSAAALWG
jgi:hypothetical protein